MTLEKKPVSIVRAMLAAGVAVPDEIMAAARKVRADERNRLQAAGLTSTGKPRRNRRTGIKADTRRQYMKAYHKLHGK